MSTIDTIHTPEEPLKELREIAPKTAEYFDIFFAMFDEYSIETLYSTKPEDASHQFPNLDDDITSLIDQAQKEFRDLASLSQHQFKAALFNLFHFLTESRPVSGHLLRDFFSAFDIPEPSRDTKEVSQPRYIIRNFNWKLRDVIQFLRALELEEKGTEGSHQMWHDPQRKELRRSIPLSLHSDRLWFKNIVKELLQAGLSLHRIETACKKLDLQFRYIIDSLRNNLFYCNGKIWLQIVHSSSTYLI